VQWSLFFLVPTGRALGGDMISPEQHERASSPTSEMSVLRGSCHCPRATCASARWWTSIGTRHSSRSYGTRHSSRASAGPARSVRCAAGPAPALTRLAGTTSPPIHRACMSPLLRLVPEEARERP
jgi:hypothetical protein